MKNSDSFPNFNPFFSPGKFLLFLLVVLSSCQYDYECKDIDYGVFAFEGNSPSPIPYHGGETLVFKDLLNHELTFHLYPYANSINRGWVHARHHLKGFCEAYANIDFREEFWEVAFKTDSLPYALFCQYQVNHTMEGNTPIMYESMRSFIRTETSDPQGLRIEMSHHTHDRGNEDHFKDMAKDYTFQDLLTLRGKEFEYVYSTIGPDGDELYFNHALGFIAFKENGKSLWVLDRIH